MQVSAYYSFTTCLKQFFYPSIDIFKPTDIYNYFTKTTSCDFTPEMKLKNIFFQDSQ